MAMGQLRPMGLSLESDSDMDDAEHGHGPHGHESHGHGPHELIRGDEDPNVNNVSSPTAEGR